jgi:hypothetical protein
MPKRHLSFCFPFFLASLKLYVVFGGKGGCFILKDWELLVEFP